MSKKIHRLTFAILDREKGILDPQPVMEKEYPLPAWYRAIRKTPLHELGIEDICKACRQQIHIEYVVPIAIRLLQHAPLAGEMYYGELLTSLKAIPIDYWSNHLAEAATLKGICEGIRETASLSEETHQDIADLLTRMVPRSHS